jgi:endonuclease YncB( thermonuclease family)
MPTENFTPGPTPTITPIPDEVRGLVVDVLSGDTIRVVMDGDPPGLTYEVRYIGIEAPPRSPDNPWGVVAYERNRQLIGMKVIRLVRDEQDFDDQGRLLRYVYAGNDMMSVAMVEQGLARAAISEPNTAFREEILAAEVRAREASLGLWGPLPTATPTRVGAAPPTSAPPSPSTSTPSATTTGTPATVTTTPGSTVTGTPAAGDDDTTPSAPDEEEPAATDTPEQ